MQLYIILWKYLVDISFVIEEVEMKPAIVPVIQNDFIRNQLVILWVKVKGKKFS